MQLQSKLADEGYVLHNGRGRRAISFVRPISARPRAPAKEQRNHEQRGQERAAEGFGIDDVIDPRDTRLHLIEALRRAPPRRRRNPAPPKRHGISPI